jgi:SAM-dependent methyltransferase
MGESNLERPAYLREWFAAAFDDADVARAYRHRLPYPPAIFEQLVRLLPAAPRTVLDVGCGRGELARPLAALVERVDAIDMAAEMIAVGRQEPGGTAPNLRWIVARAEEAPLDPPYGLVVAGQSLHWMDWARVLPRFAAALVPNGYLALVRTTTLPLPWDEALTSIIARYSTNPTYRPYDIVAAWEAAGLFTTVGETFTPPEELPQPLEEYLDAFHAMSSLTRARMGAASAEAFDAEVRALLRPYLVEGRVPLQFQGHVLWGRLHQPE